MDSMKPGHIIQENKAITAFFFEYFMQENMVKLLWMKRRLMHYVPVILTRNKAKKQYLKVLTLFKAFARSKTKTF